MQVDAQGLSGCYETQEAARAVLQDLGLTLLRVESHEPAELRTTQFHLAQFLTFSMARPSLQNGAALQRYIETLRQSLDFRATWPTEPLEDNRQNTLLEGEDHIIFEHCSEGLIRLHWMNPLPKPAWLQHGGYQCDVCFDPDIRLGYQHVTEDNARDHSKLLEERTGYDLCATCAEKHVLGTRQRILSWISSVSESRSFQRLGDKLELRLSVKRAGSAAEIEAEGSGGLHCAVAVLPLEAAVPKAWLSMGRKLASKLPGPAEPADSLGQLQLRCAQSNATVRLAAGRRQLLCSRQSAERAEWSAETPVYALQLTESEGRWRLAFQPAVESVWLRDPQQLEDLRVLASRAGCVHNIPRKPADEMQLTRSVSSSDAEWAEKSFAAHGAGTSGGFFEPSGSSDCAICLSSLGEQTWIRGAPLQTRCGHYFHRMCFRRHLRAAIGSENPDAGACPNCRAANAAEGTSHCAARPLRWRIQEDVTSQPLNLSREYRFLAVLCQDPEAVLHSAVFLTQTVMKLGDCPEAT
ncbi:unnamed protein product [Effrenium voratum]|nr:unnamed protein product [Effrenium voratum]